jgi:hypothetical protein
MIEYKFQPWPSTYKMLGETKPKKLKSNFGRVVGAFKTSIPAKTIEPPQIHLDALRDNHPFEELLTDFKIPFQVAYLNVKANKIILRKYSPGENIIIPEYIVHWLINPNSSKLEFTCEYAPHPWDGDNDEPEFKDLDSLFKYVNKKGLGKKVYNTNFLR